MKTLLKDVLETPGYIMKESVVNCFRLSGSNVLLLMKRNGIIFDINLKSQKTISFK